jgi:ribosome-associated toxin RatA of RatAB toxin-antitoxin module
MSTTPATPSATAQPKRIKKRLYIPLILLMLFLAGVAVLYVRGTWADMTERNPTTSTQGTMTQLHQKPNGNVEVRCAIVVDAPPKDVWAVVKDYDKHSTFLPYVSEVKATKQTDKRLQKIDGIAHSRLWGDWPFTSKVLHEEDPGDGIYSATWSEEDVDVFKINRGGWSVKPIDKAGKHTLLVLALQIELKKYPNFLVRNIIMDRLHAVVQAMSDETMRRKTSS